MTKPNLVSDQIVVPLVSVHQTCQLVHKQSSYRATWSRGALISVSLALRQLTLRVHRYSAMMFIARYSCNYSPAFAATHGHGGMARLRWPLCGWLSLRTEIVHPFADVSSTKRARRGTRKDLGAESAVNMESSVQLPSFDQSARAPTATKPDRL